MSEIGSTLECAYCEYSCKNRNKLRIHERTQHRKYYCSELLITPGSASKICGQRFDQHRDWKLHLVQVHKKK